MSQIPPPQYPQQPPMQPGYASPGAYSMPAQGSNGWGIASVITGIVGFCVPGLGGLLATAFGIGGILKGRKVGRGTGLSVVGLILGLLSLAMWGMFGSAIFAAFGLTKVNRTVATQFINDLAAGNISAAQAQTDGSISTTELQARSAELKGFGTLNDVTTPVTVVENDHAKLTGLLTFGANKKAYEMRQVKSGDKWKVTYFAIVDESGNAPASSTTTKPVSGSPASSDGG